MVVGQEFAGHPPDAIPPQSFRAPSPICPACGYETSASFKWCPGNQQVLDSDGCVRAMIQMCRGTGAYFDKSLLVTPHLHRQCQQCSYEWLEPCLDPGTVKFK